MVVICNAFDERFGLLYEDMEVRSDTLPSNKIMQSICTTVNSQVWRTRYITIQPTVPKFGKQINTIKFICNHFCDVLARQNLNVMEAENKYVELVEYANQYYDVKKYNASNVWSILYQYVIKTFPHIFLMIELCLSSPFLNEIMGRLFSFMELVKNSWCRKLSQENINA